MVISPFFEPLNSRQHIRHTAVIVRREFQRLRFVQPLKHHHVLIMTGGASNLHRDLIVNHYNKDYTLSVLERESRIHTLGQAQKEKKTFDASSLMNQATIVVINGGFSSISEALALAKPMIVVPVKGHMEQKINALWVRTNHFGMISSWEDIKMSIEDMKRKYVYFKRDLLGYNYLQGAKQAASLILKEL